MAKPTNWCKAMLVYGSDQKSPFINVLYYELSAAGPADKQVFVDAIAAAVRTAFLSDWEEIICATSRIYGVATQLNVGGVVYTGSTNVASSAGLVEADELPNADAVVIQKRTAQPGKEGRGRWYVGGVPETFTDTSWLNVTGMSEYNSFAEHLNETLTVSGVTLSPRHYSKKLDTMYPIVTCKTAVRLGTMRRRMVRPTLITA